LTTMTRLESEALRQPETLTVEPFRVRVELKKKKLPFTEIGPKEKRF